MTQQIMQFLVDAFTYGSITALSALGITLIFGVMRMMNFAHGDLIMVGCYLIYVFSGLPMIWAILLSVLCIMVLAVVMERIAFRPVRGADFTTLLVTSFAVSYFLQNLVMIIFGANPRGFDLSLSSVDTYQLFGIRISANTAITAVLTLVALAALWFFLKRTRMGSQMRAAADNFVMARLLGVRANGVIAGAFATSGLLAGLVSIILLSGSGTLSPGMGLGAVLTGFVATVLGGMGSLGGAVVGGFLFGLVTVAFQVFLPAGIAVYRDAFVFGVVIVVLLFRPEGLFVRKASVRERV